MFLSVFVAFSKVKICKLTMPFSLLIFGVFLKNQGLNLQHTDFSHFLREVCPTFYHHPKKYFLGFFKTGILSATVWLRLFYA